MIECSFWPGQQLQRCCYRPLKRPNALLFGGCWDWTSRVFAPRIGLGADRVPPPSSRVELLQAKNTASGAHRSDFEPRCLLCRPSGVRVGGALPPLPKLAELVLSSSVIGMMQCEKG